MWPQRAIQIYLALKSQKNTIYWKSDRFGRTEMSLSGNIAAIFYFLEASNESADRGDGRHDGPTNTTRNLRTAGPRSPDARGYGMRRLSPRAPTADDAGVGIARKWPVASDADQWAARMADCRAAPSSQWTVVRKLHDETDDRPKSTALHLEEKFARRVLVRRTVDRSWPCPLLPRSPHLGWGLRRHLYSPELDRLAPPWY